MEWCLDELLLEKKKKRKDKYLFFLTNNYNMMLRLHFKPFYLYSLRCQLTQFSYMGKPVLNK